MLIVHETDAERDRFREPMTRPAGSDTSKTDQCDKEGNLLSGLTPPTFRIVKRRFQKTGPKAVFKYGLPGLFKPEDVSRAEAELADPSSGAVHEELVDFEDYMVDQQGKGVTVDAESDLVRKHPEIMMTCENDTTHA